MHIRPVERLWRIFQSSCWVWQIPVADISGSWLSGDMIYWVLIRLQNLDDAVFVESPLVEQTDYLLTGVGFSWIFARNL